MTDRPIQDLAALLNEPEPLEPEDAIRRAELAEALRAALTSSAESRTQPGREAQTLAAHLEEGLSETDRQSVVSAAARSPEALANLEASAALLETVAANPQTVSAEQAAQAHAIFAGAQPAPKRSRWAAGFKAVSPLQLGLSFSALAAVAAVAIFYPSATTQPPIGPSTGGGSSSGVASTFLPTDTTTTSSSAPSSATARWRGTDAPAPGRSQGWTAVALSASGHVYGTAANWPTEAEGKLAALATCVKEGGQACAVAATAQGQCVAAAVLGDAAPATAQANDRETAESKAMEACGGGACLLVVTRCSGPPSP